MGLAGVVVWAAKYLFSTVGQAAVGVFVLAVVNGILIAIVLGYLEDRTKKSGALIVRSSVETRKRTHMKSPGAAPEMVIPKTWDPDEVAIHLRSLQHNPNVAKVFIASLVTRFVTGQDNLVANPETSCRYHSWGTGPPDPGYGFPANSTSARNFGPETR
jgi:hypothetical protein